jgi:hypothetical protein
MKNTADVTVGKPIAVLLQSISGVRAFNPLVAFYDIHGGKREVLFFYFVLDTTRDNSTTRIYYVFLVLTRVCISLRHGSNGRKNDIIMNKRNSEILSVNYYNVDIVDYDKFLLN